MSQIGLHGRLGVGDGVARVLPQGRGPRPVGGCALDVAVGFGDLAGEHDEQQEEDERGGDHRHLDGDRAAVVSPPAGRAHRSGSGMNRSTGASLRAVTDQANPGTS